MTNDGQIERVSAGQTATNGAAGVSLAKSGETSSLAMAEAAKANVLARFYQARTMPRDTLDVRVRVLKECERPRLAELAVYELPRGRKPDGTPNFITGPSIRLAEAFLRTWGNLHVEAPVVYEDAEKRIITVTVTDLETNATLSDGIIVEKVVERRSPKDKNDIIGQRLNSEGKPVYLVRANETDLLAKQNALKSKSIRTLVLRLIPGDLVDEAMERANETYRKGVKDDPTRALARIVDAFADLNVLPSSLAEALGHPLERCTPAEIERLRGWYSAIKNGDATVDEIIAKAKPSDAAPTTDEAPATSAASRVKAAAAKVAKPAADAPADDAEAKRRADARARGEDPDA